MLKYIARFATVWFLAFAASTVSAKDLPQGEFLLTGPVFPGIQQGHIVPVLAHARIEGNRIHWSFMTSYGGDDISCQNFDKCSRVVQTLTYDVAWDDKGVIRIEDSHRVSGKGLGVDRNDSLHIYAALRSFVDGAELNLTEDGGTMTGRVGRRTSPRVVQWHPLSLQQTLEAQSFMLSFEQSFARLNHCGIRQFAEIAAKPDPSPIEKEILAAGKYYQSITEFNDTISYYFGGDIPADKQASIDEAKAKDMALRVIMVFGSEVVRDAREQGKPAPSDADILLGISQDIPASLRARTEEFAPGYLDEVLTTRQAEYLAVIRHQNRYAEMIQSGADPLAAICKNIRMLQ